MTKPCSDAPARQRSRNGRTNNGTYATTDEEKPTLALSTRAPRLCGYLRQPEHTSRSEDLVHFG
jgi:hypothetical protein